MQPLRLAAVPILACAALSACREQPPTSSAPPPAAVGLWSQAEGAIGFVTVPPEGAFTSQALSRGSFPDAIDATFRIKHGTATKVVHVDDPSDVIMARIAIPPGVALPWHTHPGPAIAVVASGELTVIEGEGCEARVYAMRGAFVDPGQGHVHTAYNASNVETVVYVTYLDVPAGQTPLIRAPDPGC